MAAAALLLACGETEQGSCDPTDPACDTTPAPTVTTASLADGIENMPYAVTLRAEDGDGTFTWSVVSGALPSGLGLSGESGEIAGTPTEPGSFDFTIEVTSGGRSAQAALSIEVHAELQVTTTELPAGAEAVDYLHAITGEGGSEPYAWSVVAGQLPPGLNLDDTSGQVSGTPTTAGDFDFTVELASGPQTKQNELAITVHPELAVTTAALPDGVVDLDYGTHTLTATGGDGTHAWSVATGSSLPPGLALDGATGIVTGTPTAVGWFAFTLEVTSASHTVRQAFTVDIHATMAVTTASLAAWIIDIEYGTVTLTAVGATGTYSWELASGSGPLPTGLSLASNGDITGTPTAVGTFDFTVQASSGGSSAQKALSITVHDALAVSTASLADGIAGSAYATQTLTATGGLGTYVWGLAAGSTLPTGLSLASNGDVTGTPSAEGAFDVTVQVTSGPATTPRTLSLTIHPALAVTTTSLAAGTEDVDYGTETLTATGGTGTYAWALASGSAALPTGLALSPTGDITGTPTVPGTYEFTVEVTEGAARALRSLTIVVHGELVVTTPALVDGIVGYAYGESLHAAGGDGSYTWSVVSGALPTDLSLAGDGQATGTPSLVETQAFTVQVTSGDGQLAQQPLSITILATPPVLLPTDSCRDFPGASIGTLADPDLEAALRANLGITPSDDLTCDLLATVETLSVGGLAPAEADGLQNLTGLTSLDLSGGTLTASVLPIVGNFTDLLHLNLSGNEIDAPDLDDLSGLTKLESLVLTGTRGDFNEPIGNRFDDISAIAGMTELTQLQLGRLGLTDVSAVSGLTNLTRLTLETNAISDISPVAGLTDLTFLFLSRNRIEDISSLANLTKLTFFAINHNRITDVSAMAGMTELSGILWLYFNQITSLDGAEGKPNITQVLATDNLITDVSTMDEVDVRVNLRANGHLENIDALLDNTSLTGVTVDLRGTNVSCTDQAELEANGAFVSGECTSAPTAASVGVHDDFANNYFISRSVGIAAGGTVTWTWTGLTDHNVTFASGPSSPTQTTGTFERTFNDPGVYDFECTIHTGMTGRVIVR